MVLIPSDIETLAAINQMDHTVQAVMIGLI